MWMMLRPCAFCLAVNILKFITIVHAYRDASHVFVRNLHCDVLNGSGANIWDKMNATKIAFVTRMNAASYKFLLKCHTLILVLEGATGAPNSLTVPIGWIIFGSGFSSGACFHAVER